MSYPAMLQALVIEDEEGPKVAYEEIFKKLASESSGLPFRPAPPRFAFSYEQALQFVEGSKIFHLVILDLRLPQRQGMPELEDEELGLDLLIRCANRDRFPIPAALVISGHIGSTDQIHMQQTLHQGFCYGRPLVKGDFSLLEEAIRRACREVARYTAVGIHLRASGRDQYPTLSPRDEDLLRRSVLQENGRIGLDLDWWSAKLSRDQSLDSTVEPQWTKVLMGRYLLDEDGGASRPMFFKLMPTSEAQSAIDGARRAAQRLAHITIVSSVVARSASLMVTEKVGAQDARPRPLGEVFGDFDSERMLKIARQIASQVDQLGDLLPESRPLRAILWPAHDVGNLAGQWSRFRDDLPLQAGAEPVNLYSRLSVCEERIRLNMRSIVHGDLHIGNVALDVSDGSAEAYVFDPGACGSDVAGRDIASLEVSAILHQRIAIEAVIEICSALYRSSGPSEVADAGALSAQVGNTIQFVTGLRAAVAGWNDRWLYALMVFDSALIQVGGLATELSGNYIDDPRCAVYVLAAAAAWYQSLQSACRATST
jgi:CheY-like chemotaxis protein